MINWLRCKFESSPGTKSRGVFVQNHPEQTKYRTSNPNRAFGVVREAFVGILPVGDHINCSDANLALTDMLLPRYSGVRPAMRPATNTAQSNRRHRARYGAISALARCRSSYEGLDYEGAITEDH